MTITKDMEPDILTADIDDLWKMYYMEYLEQDGHLDLNWKSEHDKVKHGFRLNFDIRAVTKAQYVERPRPNRKVWVDGYGQWPLTDFDDEVDIRTATMRKRLISLLTDPSVMEGR